MRFLFLILGLFTSVSKAQSNALFLKIYEREAGVTSDKWSEAIQTHLLKLKQNGLVSIKFDIEENKLVEYAQFQNDSEFLDADFEEFSSLVYSIRK